MAAKALPFILAGGAALLLMGGSKKKKKKTIDNGEYEADPYEYLPEDDEEMEPYIPVAPDPRGKDNTPSRPSGNPPRGDSYDGEYWGSTTEEQLTGIRQHFVDLGYKVEVGPYPMNILGPKGSVEMKNIDGTMGKLGGSDDLPNDVVKLFQHQYNLVSRLNKAEKLYPVTMGGVNEDGAVGPFTLNALRTAKEHLPGGKTWPDILMMAANKGIF